MTVVRDDGRNVVRILQELRIHPALEETGCCPFIPEVQEVSRCQDLVLPEQPVLVTHRGIIVAGFGRWRMAVAQGISTMECREYTLTDEDALHFMLSLQKRREHWSPFVRIRLALKLEETLQQRALGNQKMGGKYKGSANLPKAARIDVREEIAAIAGAGGRNVSKVKEILDKCHPRILGELANGSISINRAHQFCRLPLTKQVGALTESYCEQVASDVERALLWQRKDSRPLEGQSVLNTLQDLEKRQPGSISIQFSRRKQSVILIGEDLQLLMQETV
jgi:ParB-like chromosome segregation protein Spo0J